MIMETKDRIEKAVELFKSGYNCSQSVVGAFADMYGFTEEQAFRMSASFGGGIGRMRQTCGAACGMFLLAGLEKGAVEGKDCEGKAANYALVQELAAEFKKRNGSLICAELLGLRKPEGSSVPEARTEHPWAARRIFHAAPADGSRRKCGARHRRPRGSPRRGGSSTRRPA